MKLICKMVLCIVILFTHLFGQDTVRNHEITLEDYFTQAYIECCTASPDGQHIAYIEWRWDQQKDGQNWDLWVVNVETKISRRLTDDWSKDEKPQWGSDGQTIYFIGHYKHQEEERSPYDGKAQVWCVNIDGNGLKPITSVPGGVDEYRITKDGMILYYTIRKDHMIEEWKDLRSEFKDDVKFGHGIEKVSELWKLDLNSGRETKLIDPYRFIRYFEVSPDGKRIAMVTNPNDLLITHEGQSEIEVFDTVSGTMETLPDQLWREQAPSPYGWLENPSWSSDGKLLAFSIDFDGYPVQVFAAEWTAGKVKVSEIPRPEGISVADELHWLPDKDILCFLGDHRARQRVYGIDYKNGSHTVLTPGDVVVDDYDFVSDNGFIITLQSQLTYHRDLFLYHSSAEPTRITKVNPQVDKWHLPQISLFEWEGANGDKVEGILELPPDYKGEKKLPLIVEIHGGPTASRKYEYKFQIYGRTAFAAKGYAVFSPNYHGSTGYGDKFLTDLIGRENDIEVEDILKGVDALIESGIADPDRLGVMGWSNGGFLTDCLIATNRFKTASSGAGVIDQALQWGEEDTPGHVINYTLGLPWENPKRYQNASPLYSFNSSIKTATLIHAGEDDKRVPVTHSKALHRALSYYIKVPCELLVYPGATHSLKTYRHRLAKMKWDHAWFDKYLGMER